MRIRQSLTLTLAVLCAALASPAAAGWDEGVAAFKAKNYAQAVREFEAVVAEKPDWSGGYLMLGRSLLQIQRASEAVTALRKGYDLTPSDVQIQLALAQAYLTANRPRESAQLLGKINAGSLPKEQQGFYQQLQAKALADSGQSDQAAAALARAAAANPNDADVQFQYGAMALNAGDTAAAVSALEKAARLDPNDLGKAKLHVQALIRQARETSSDAVYARAAEAGRGLAAKSASYEHLMLLGEAQLGANQYDASIATFQQALAKNAADWLPGYYIGQAQTVQQKYGEAEDALKRALAKAGRADEKARVWRQLGFVYEKQKNFPQAKTAYQNGGDAKGVARIEQNEQIAAHNKQAEAEAAKVAEIRKAQEALKEKLKQEGAPPPRD